ncbi:hypothetical protein ACIHCQ_10960 [Streptomyces sp. NPDC052236]|uniref:hypothetical protein n=1 Tax=Streptomyces sp. NPDC052236 TaxID=3365686 RepID=UPI0037CE27E7
MCAFIYDRHAPTSTVILDIRLNRCRAYAQSRSWEIAGTWLDLGNCALGHHRPDDLCAAMRLETGPVVCLVHGLGPSRPGRLAQRRHAPPRQPCRRAL